MSAETANDAYRAHRLSLVDRKTMNLTGITDVIGFDEESVSLESSLGRLEIDGENLHVEVLNLKDGVLELTGKINSVSYFADRKSEPTQKGLLAKIFR